MFDEAIKREGTGQADEADAEETGQEKRERPVKHPYMTRERQSIFLRFLSIQRSIDEIRRVERLQRNNLKQDTDKKLLRFFNERKSLLVHYDHFWVKCFENHPQISADRVDGMCLNHLTEFEVVSDFSGPEPSYSMEFTFEENPHFEKGTYKKLITFAEEGIPIISSTPLKWKKDNPGFTVFNEQKREEEERNAGEIDREKSDMGIIEFIDAKGEDTPRWMTSILLYDIWISPMQHFIGEKI